MDARAVTRLRVLNCIRERGEASRTDIAAALRLSPATVTFVTSGLMSGGLIEEVAASESDNSKRGRPRVALRMAQARFHVAGIKITRKDMSILILDWDGTEVAHSNLELSASPMDPMTLVKTIARAVEDTCKDIEGGTDSVAGLSIGLAGQIDWSTRYVHWSSSLTERNVDFGSLLEEHLPYPAFVDNDANLAAKAEQLFGEAKGLENFLVVTVEHGVGLGIVLDGRLYRGQRGCGAEFGHTKVAINGALCQCGQRGCLEAYVGGYAILREAEEKLGQKNITAVKDVVDAADAGDPAAQSILDQTGEFFAMGLANLINLFDPERIVLTGAKHRIAHLCSDDVLGRVARNVVNVDAPLPDIRVHHYSDKMWARGAAAMGIDQVSALKVQELGKNAT
ncbi:ROK family transcriptional regulator [Planktotalea sp.]|uniref:ROK family transcriptional regulator n=1 Tax=Planktotalea sp. TaxID=2029877 RepID=UPI0032976B24